MGNEIQNMLSKFSIEDMEKLKVLFSIMPQTEQKEIVTLRVFVEEYKNIIRNNRSSSYLKSVTISLGYLVEYFGAQKPISSIQLKDIENFVIHLQRIVKKGYVVYFRNLKAAFNKAKDWKYISENHFLKVKLPKKQRVNPAYINGDQLAVISQQLAEGNDNVVRDVAVFAFGTGMRLNEIVNLRWKNVNLATRIITVGDEDFTTKGRNQRYIPISDEALTSILSQRERKKAIPIGNSFVFSKPNGDPFTGDYFSKRFKRACKSAGIDKSIHFHSLRHSFASNLAQKGVSLYTIKELLGHSSITTTEIYSHLNMDSLKEAIETLNQPHPRQRRAGLNPLLSARGGQD
ncbi:MAG: tyrosine-type recombinase/integrase [Ignavibacteria bacterium]|nr:tyrosine-type recombinase/integrase [Ignavibacteria bacterium]